MILDNIGLKHVVWRWNGETCTFGAAMGEFSAGIDDASVLLHLPILESLHRLEVLRVGGYILETYVSTSFLQAFLWECFPDYAPEPLTLDEIKMALGVDTITEFTLVNEYHLEEFGMCGWYDFFMVTTSSWLPAYEKENITPVIVSDPHRFRRQLGLDQDVLGDPFRFTDRAEFFLGPKANDVFGLRKKLMIPSRNRLLESFYMKLLMLTTQATKLQMSLTSIMYLLMKAVPTNMEALYWRKESLWRKKCCYEGAAEAEDSENIARVKDVVDSPSRRSTRGHKERDAEADSQSTRENSKEIDKKNAAQ
ncbi:hypothetical protein L484_008973 [Morus notabilis]|uniref:Aminotransferase-like plant mobile domain-containing protein n=1 Tax=Morus notabilis TaxID=981085 RepID=W9SZ31_9ROSA|nr:hypothetical protein L484_008973 [Morus notabilis]